MNETTYDMTQNQFEPAASETAPALQFDVEKLSHLRERAEDHRAILNGLQERQNTNRDTASDLKKEADWQTHDGHEVRADTRRALAAALEEKERLQRLLVKREAQFEPVLELVARCEKWALTQGWTPPIHGAPR